MKTIIALVMFFVAGFMWGKVITENHYEVVIQKLEQQFQMSINR